jgi:hypothetical protein
MIRKTKRFELMNFFFYNPFEYIWFKVLLILKIMDFENVLLTKVVHIYVIERMNA